MADSEKSSASKISLFLEKNFKIILGFILVIFAFIIVGVVASSINKNAAQKGLSQIDSIDYAFRKDTQDMSAEDFTAHQDTALQNLEVLCNKTGIVGVRANMLKAEILFQKKDFEQSRSAWDKAASAKKSAYTAPICNYNAAICSENLGDLDSAVTYYLRSLDADEFYLSDHAYFSLGRVYEAKKEYDNAISAYEKIIEEHVTSPWASLAKSRIISLNADKAE